MEQPNPNTPQPTEPPQSTSTSSPIPSPSPNPNPNPNLQNPQTRPPFTRTWPQPPSHFQHFSSSSSASPSPSSSAVAAAPSSTRGGVALGVPAHHPTPPPQPSSFSSLGSASYAQQFGGLGRNPGSVADSAVNSNSSQVRQSIHGMQGMGMMGSMGSGSQMRPGGIPAHHQQRPIQSSLRPQSSLSNQSPSTQNFQGHGLVRVSPMGSPASPAPTTSQNQPSHTQPWLSSVSQGKPPLPSPAFRPQMNPQSMQQRSHIPPPHHHPFSSSASQQQQISSTQQPQQAHQSQDHYGQQFPPSRVPQSLAHQQPITRVHGHGPGSQKPTSLAMVQQPSTVQPGPHSRTTTTDTAESGDRILSKRSIHELVTQIDPLEKLDPEVEDILVEIADEFVESITTFGCSLAKHRKSTTLEGKDILLHLERNWNMTLPGFGGDEIKIYKKPFSNDIHRERLAAIKKSMVGTETAGVKNSAGQAGNAKAHLAKPPSNVLGSPKP